MPETCYCSSNAALLPVGMSNFLGRQGSGFGVAVYMRCDKMSNFWSESLVW